MDEFFDAATTKSKAIKKTTGPMETFVIFKLATYFKESADKLVVEYPVRTNLLMKIVSERY